MNPTSYGKAALDREAASVRYSRPGTRHNTLTKAAYSLGTLVPAHLPEAMVLAVLTDAAKVAAVDATGSDPFTDREISTAIRDGIRAGKANPRIVSDGYASRQDSLRDLALISACWDITPLGGWKGRRCKQVMPAVLSIAYDIGGPLNVPLAQHRVAITAGTNRLAVSKALRDLVEEGWLTLRTRGGPGRSSRYDIHLPPDVSRTDTHLILLKPHMWGQPDNAMVGHDAGRRECLGPTGLRILEWLSQSPGQWHRQTEVARALGIHAGTIGRYVKVESLLVKSGLLERDDKARVRSIVPLSLMNLDELAKAALTLGHRDRDRARLVSWFQSQGFLDADLYWIDQRDGSRGAKAEWLVPEKPFDRLSDIQKVDPDDTGRSGEEPV